MWDQNVPDIVRAANVYASVQLWSDDPTKVQAFQATVTPGYANEVRGCNEVNEGGQANMPVDRGVTVWKNVIQPYGNQGFDLSSHCTSSNPDGFEWITQFISECQDCWDHTNYASLHWYDVKEPDFEAYINKWATLGKQMKVTEFACQNFNGGDQPSMDEIWAFTTAAVTYLNNDPRVMVYCPFGFMDDLQNVNPADGLFDPDGKDLSALGSYYAQNA
jgi:hypothetical protein